MTKRFQEGDLAIWRSAALRDAGADDPVMVRILRTLRSDRYMVEFAVDPAARIRDMLESGTLTPVEEAFARSILAERADDDALLEQLEELPLDAPFAVDGNELEQAPE